MKKNYFDDKNYLKKLFEFKNSRKKDIDLKSKKTALLIIDMQKYFTDKSSRAYVPASEAIIPRIKSVSGAFDKNGMTVIITRHINTEKNAGTLFSWWSDIIERKNPLSEICGDLKEAGILIEKTRYDAFYKSSLDSVLKKKKIRQVLITGVMTHLCCETTARSAFVRDYEVLFAIDGNATYNRDFHSASLLNLSHGFANPVLTSEIIKKLK